MTVIYILLVALGALPLVLFFIKRKRYYHIIRNGVKTTAEVTDVKTTRFRRGGAYDRVLYAYLPVFANQYQTDIFATKPGKVKKGDQLEIYYLPDNPSKSAVPGSKGEFWMFLFLLAIFLFVLYACYKLKELTGSQEIHFNP